MPIKFLKPITIQNGRLPDGSERFFDLVEYEMGDTGFSVNNAETQTVNAKGTSGSAFTQHILTYFARVLEFWHEIKFDNNHTYAA